MTIPVITLMGNRAIHGAIGFLIIDSRININRSAFRFPDKHLFVCAYDAPILKDHNSKHRKRIGETSIFHQRKLHIFCNLPDRNRNRFFQRQRIVLFEEAGSLPAEIVTGDDWNQLARESVIVAFFLYFGMPDTDHGGVSQFDPYRNLAMGRYPLFYTPMAA